MSVHRNAGFKPRYQPNAYRPSPTRRESIYGRIQGLPDAPKIIDRLARVFIVLMGVVVAVLVASGGLA